MYFKPETQTAFTTHSEIRAAHPDVSFPASITDDTLVSHGIYPLTSGHDFGVVAQVALDAQAAKAIEQRKQAILAELQTIDLKSIRALREGYQPKIDELEAQAQALRTELAGL